MGQNFGGGPWLFPDGASEQDGSAEVERVLRLLYRLNIAPAGDALQESRTGHSIADLNRAIPRAILDAMEAEGLLERVAGESDPNGSYYLTAEGRRVSRRAGEHVHTAPAAPVAVLATYGQVRLSAAAELVLHQRALVAKMRDNGQATELAAALLQQLERSYQLMRRTLATLAHKLID
jgi:DNA-binding MarR family transcriptional regulator